MGLERPLPIGTRGVTLLAIGIAGSVAFLALGLAPRDLLPRGEGGQVLIEFLAHAATPALDYESAFIPEGATPFWLKVATGLTRTLVFAIAAISLSLLSGVALGFLGSTAWWEGDPAGRRSISRWLGPTIWSSTRVLISLMRSVHELLWAVLFLAAMGFSNLAAVIAIAIPYGGTLAKVFSEILDEAPQDAAVALRGAGASHTQVFFFGLLPRALPDMAAYAFYRFECCLRSSAILGFFGLETLGKFIKESWEEAYYGEVWTYLYTLFALVVLMEWWSSALRRRVVA